MPASTLAILGRRVADLLAMPASLGRCVASRWWQRLACVRACVCRPATCRARSGSGSRVSSHHRRPALLGVAAACVCPCVCRTTLARRGQPVCRREQTRLPSSVWRRANVSRPRQCIQNPARIPRKPSPGEGRRSFRLHQGRGLRGQSKPRRQGGEAAAATARARARRAHATAGLPAEPIRQQPPAEPIRQQPKRESHPEPRHQRGEAAVAKKWRLRKRAHMPAEPTRQAAPP